MSRRTRRRPSAAAPEASPPEPGWRQALARPPAILLSLGLVLVLQIMWGSNVRSVGIDFYQFWVAAQVPTSMEVDNPYDPAERMRIGAEFARRAQADESAVRWQGVATHRSVIDTYHSPFLYTVFAPLASGDYDADYLFYRHLCLLLTVASVLTLCHLAGLPLLEALGVLLILLAGFDPIRSDLTVGNVSQLQLAALTLYAWIQSRPASTRRDLLGGFVLGLAVLFKPTVVAVVAVLGLSWLVVGDWRKIRDQAVGAVAGASAAVVGTGLFWGKQAIWLDFLGSLPIPDDLVPFADGNYAPAEMLREATGMQLAPLLLVGAVALTGWLLWKRRDGLRNASQPDLVALALGCLVMLISTPVSWVHYYMVAVPALVVAVGWALRTRQPGAAVLVVAACVLPLLALAPMGSLWSAAPRIYATLVSVGMVVLFAIAVRSLEPQGNAPRLHTP